MKVKLNQYQETKVMNILGVNLKKGTAVVLEKELVQNYIRIQKEEFANVMRNFLEFAERNEEEVELQEDNWIIRSRVKEVIGGMLTTDGIKCKDENFIDKKRNVSFRNIERIIIREDNLKITGIIIEKKDTREWEIIDANLILPALIELLKSQKYDLEEVNGDIEGEVIYNVSKIKKEFHIVVEMSMTHGEWIEAEDEEVAEEIARKKAENGGYEQYFEDMKLASLEDYKCECDEERWPSND